MLASAAGWWQCWRTTQQWSGCAAGSRSPGGRGSAAAGAARGRAPRNGEAGNTPGAAHNILGGRPGERGEGRTPDIRDQPGTGTERTSIRLPSWSRGWRTSLGSWAAGLANFRLLRKRRNCPIPPGGLCSPPPGMGPTTAPPNCLIQTNSAHTTTKLSDCFPTHLLNYSTFISFAGHHNYCHTIAP